MIRMRTNKKEKPRTAQEKPHREKGETRRIKHWKSKDREGREL